MFLGRAALGVSVCGAAFGHVGSASRHYMIGGVCAVVKGGFPRIRRRTQDRGDSRLRGNDGRGCGNGGTKGVGMVGWGAGSIIRCVSFACQ